MFSLSFKIVMDFASLLDEEAGGMWVQRSSSRLLRKKKKNQRKSEADKNIFTCKAQKKGWHWRIFLKIYIFGYFLPAFDTSVV